jgi:hypothetical protein
LKPFSDGARVDIAAAQIDRLEMRINDTFLITLFQIRNDRQSKRLLANLRRMLLFHFFLLIKTGIRDILLDIYSTYSSFE